MDIYELAKTLSELHDLKTSKIAVLVLPGTDFDMIQFLETCSVNRGMQVDTFTNFEDAVHWFFKSEEISADATMVYTDRNKE
ncbi:MAG: hypothetical protein R2864_09350 [Syntrophotaleaceae bacterium]